MWGIECAAVGERIGRRSRRSPASRPAIWAIATGRAIHLLGPLAGKVIRVSPPLVMPLDEAREYLDAMHDIFSTVAGRLAKSAT